MSTAVFSIVINLFHAEAMVCQLIMEGFSIHAASLLLAHKNGKPDFMNELNAATPNGLARGGVGGILDGSLAGLGEVCALEIPGKGSYLAVGPIMSALSGSFNLGGSGLSDTLVALLGVPNFFNFVALEVCRLIAPTNRFVRVYSRVADVTPESILPASLSVPMLLIGLVLLAFAFLCIIDSYRCFLEMVKKYNNPSNKV